PPPPPPTAIANRFSETPISLLRIAQKAEKSHKNLGFLMQLQFSQGYDILFFVKKQVFSAWIQFFCASC
ncbi:MAG: hypothetical protein MSS60_03265, partial [Clostridiales bacterium]|nr:hypothetical protein [Clostridiales bacterium]